MFASRRQRQPVPQPLTAATANPNAATAAAAVFKRHESNTSLSAAAAAAALAARPITPTRVADVQTKRTLRRSLSAASSAASSDGHPRPALERRGSSGSMTERSFRSPSPHRPSSSGSGHRQSLSLTYRGSAELPPVPALPKDVERNTGVSGVAAQQAPPHRRATSTGISNTPLRLASQSLGSADSPSWFGAAKLGDPRNVRRTDPAMASPPSSPPQMTGDIQLEGARPSSRASSINFSYPARVRLGSPPVSPVDARHSAELPPRTQPQPQQQPIQPGERTRPSRDSGKKRPSASESPRAKGGPRPNSMEQELVYDPNSRRMVPKTNYREAEFAVVKSTASEPNPRRRKQSSQGAGSHLAQGAMSHANIREAAPSHEKQITSIEGGSRRQTQAQERVSLEASHGFGDSAVKNDTDKPTREPQARSRTSSENSDAVQQRRKSPQPSTTTPLSLASIPWDSSRQPLKRQPSVVKEEPEPQAEDVAQMTISDALDSVPARQRVRIEASPETSAGSQGMPNVTASPPPGNGPDVDVEENPPPFLAKQSSLQAVQSTKVAPERTSSISPIRQAHFGPVSTKLTVKYSPPPRSISPRKSALKHSSPSRGASPSDDNSEASGTLNAPEEAPISRKKSVRVSFDDDNTVVVGEAAPVVQHETPQLPAGRRPWYSSFGRNIKDFSSLDDDEIMKPRPALPSFGSIRERKVREPIVEEEERPLVRPSSDRLSSTTTSKPADLPLQSPEALSRSNDHAIGAILTEEEENSRNKANTSRFREPLPPVVTSVEGGGYMSDSSSSSSRSEDETSASSKLTITTAEASQIPTSDSPIVPSKAATDGLSDGEVTITAQEGPDQNEDREITIPEISILQPTPPVQEKTADPYLFLNVPGGFPQDESDLSAPEVPTNTLVPEATQNLLPRISSQPKSDGLLAAESTSDSETSIYSDAFEDLSDMEDAGFRSLDAVLEKSMSTQTSPRKAREEVPNSKTGNPGEADQGEPRVLNPMSTPSAQPSGLEDEWEKAKAYWRSLTAEKRAQLEREAIEDAGVEADLEETKPEPKPKKKKSVERRHSERKALASQLAQQTAAAQNQNNSAESAGRTYMIQPGTRWSDTGHSEPWKRPHPNKAQKQQYASTASDDNSWRLRKSMRTAAPVMVAGEPIKPSWTRPAARHPPTMPLASSGPIHPATANRTVSEGASPKAVRLANPGGPIEPIKRRGSTSSESSFKRSRPGSSIQSSGFRMSMRPTPPSRPEKDTSQRFSLRSLSPASSGFGRTSQAPPISLTTGSQIRQTLRDSSSERKKASGGIRMPTFKLSPGSKKGKRASTSHFSSRFADSSDEDVNPKKAGFRSRFEDSSDEETVTPLVSTTQPPAIGQLRNQDSTASTALPEELEESDSAANPELPAQHAEKVTTAAVPVARSHSASMRPTRAGSGRLPTSQTAPVLGGSATTKGADRHTGKRSSLMTVLRRRKPDSSGKISRPVVTESAARQDTKLERNTSQLRGIRKASTEAPPEDDDGEEEDGLQAEPPKSPRLQKRIVSLARSIEHSKVDDTAADPDGVAGTHDLLPSPQGFQSPGAAATEPNGFAKDEEFIPTPPQRPSGTSANLGTRTLSGGSSAQPGFLGRRTLSSGVMSIDAPSTVGTTGQKKKKFGALRRMFGLHD
ncbi:hypothetical protein QBC47DRAFT_123358 [Echria macrotheca]|uniref:Uncharacterized protein n=1 Tax=Echria macrotheca TaxID=438768 RepID=A0AAJ0F6L6_9PEZI|nr:hypothetical protein QBC47DRAFT_123358 [Echria macrotheca]